MPGILMERPEFIAYQNIVLTWPYFLDKVISDWRLFKAGVNAGLFNQDEKDEVIGWYDEFSDLWEAVKPNFSLNQQYSSAGLRDENMKMILKVDSFLWEIHQMRLDNVSGQLGLAPILIAGVLVAAAFGIAGVIWAVGYTRAQNNISNMINETVAGNLPPEILQAAMEAGPDEGLFDKLGGALETIIIAGVATAGISFFWPQIKKMLKI